MSRDPRARLLDILVACDLLADFTRGKSFEDYAADALLRFAVERQLEIIGEALRVAVQHRPVLATQITDVPAIIAFRNPLALQPAHLLTRPRRVSVPRASMDWSPSPSG
jgi:uncharacterized protein with HEPN domain